MIGISYSNSIWEEDNLVEFPNTKYPQYIHQITDGGMAVSKGLKTLPAVLAEQLLQSPYEGITPITAIQGLDSRHKSKGFILATGGTIWTGYGAATGLIDEGEYPKLKVLPMGMTQIYAGYLAGKLGNFNYVSTDATSCVSAHAALNQAYHFIQAGLLDACVVLSVDSSTSPEFIKFFAENNLCDTDLNIASARFHLGQGANITLIEKEPKNCRIELLNTTLYSEHYSSPLGISPTGDGYREAIRQVMEGTDISPDFIKTHSTYSEDNEVEAEVVTELFGDIPTYDYKHRIGHTMGASTAVEMDIATRENSGTFISLGAGMGNVFTAVLGKTT